MDILRMRRGYIDYDGFFNKQIEWDCIDIVTDNKYELNNNYNEHGKQFYIEKILDDIDNKRKIFITNIIIGKKPIELEVEELKCRVDLITHNFREYKNRSILKKIFNIE